MMMDAIDGNDADGDGDDLMISHHHHEHDLATIPSPPLLATMVGAPLARGKRHSITHSFNYRDYLQLFAT